MTVDGERHDVTGYSVAVGNSKAYGGGMFVLPEAELDDGKLDVLISKEAPEAHVPARGVQDLQGAPTSTPPTPSSCAAR